MTNPKAFCSHRSVDKPILLSKLEANFLWVHRWTAHALFDRIDNEDYQFYCCNGGFYLQQKLEKTPSLETAIEGVRLLLNGHAWDESTALTQQIVSFLENYGQMIDLAAFCGEVTAYRAFGYL